MRRLVHRLVVIALAALPLAACVSAADIRRADEAQCTSYGFQPGTSDFAACLQRESLARRYPPLDPWGPVPYWGPMWR